MKSKRPRPKRFDDYKYRAIIDQLHERMPGKELEGHCTSIVEDILINYEGFEWIEKGPEFRASQSLNVLKNFCNRLIFW